MSNPSVFSLEVNLSTLTNGLSNVSAQVNRAGVILSNPQDYYVSVTTPGKKLLTQESLALLVKKFHGWIHGITGSDEESIIKQFGLLRAKTEVSQIAERYQKTYNISLAEDLKTIDYTPFGLKIGKPDLPSVISAISSLPDK
jgi:hypothetical protein